MAGRLPDTRRIRVVTARRGDREVFKDGYLRGTCPIMLGNNVSYDYKTNLEIKRTKQKQNKFP